MEVPANLHGTLGIGLTLGRVGRASGHADLVDLSLAGAADTAVRDEAGPEGFLALHSTPQYFPMRSISSATAGATARPATPRSSGCCG